MDIFVVDEFVSKIHL